MRRRPPLVAGTTYNNWTVVEQLDLVYVVCKCSCDREAKIMVRHLLSGKSTQCRTCANRQANHAWRRKDGARYPKKIKTAVTDAIARCTNKDHRCYPNWGGRGITVYPIWLQDPRLFVEYLMQLNGASNPDLILDRINNDAGYLPGNLRWTTYKESASNQRHRNGRKGVS